ncbi:MKI67 FHA domain-interacting nucleolar phosphoprotein-like isoform X2 [Ornithodoros turicata]|uniref:MKI67 FHA domain-interacting nucleolar phosphoprotein-like isoform X2 n=1 Tax=Ornithodoros turicata TaxID=34597 RepID=UPI00313A33BD
MKPKTTPQQKLDETTVKKVAADQPVKTNPKKKQNRRSKTKRKVEEEYLGPKGVIYIKHIPHGFYEEEMRKFFSQFGIVTNLRLSRSGKTGRSRGYAFVEFASEDVAKIVAETMDGYLFFNKLLRCYVMPKEKVHPGLFKDFRYPFPLRKEIVRSVNNRKRTLEEDQKSARRRIEKLKKTQKKLKKMGLSYDFQPQIFDEQNPSKSQNTVAITSPANGMDEAAFTVVGGCLSACWHLKKIPVFLRLQKTAHNTS